MQKIKYCLPIIADTFDEVRAELNLQKDSYDYFEVWLDYLSDYNRETLSELCKEFGSRLILLFRRQRLEPILMSLEERLEVMKIAAATGTFVDLDIRVQAGELDTLQDMTTKLNVILSYHNYNETPNDEFLQLILQKMRSYAPTIYKFSCYCLNRGDALRLLKLQRELDIGGYHSIVFGMGPKGLVTRVFAPLWGAEMVFAPLTCGKASAEGQLTKGDLETVFGIICNY